MTVKVSILIAGVNEARFLVQHDLFEGNGNLIKMYAIQRKNQIIINVGVNKKNQITGVLAKMFMCGILT